MKQLLTKREAKQRQTEEAVLRWWDKMKDNNRPCRPVYEYIGQKVGVSYMTVFRVFERKGIIVEVRNNGRRITVVEPAEE